MVLDAGLLFISALSIALTVIMLHYELKHNITLAVLLTAVLLVKTTGEIYFEDSPSTYYLSSYPQRPQVKQVVITKTNRPSTTACCINRVAGTFWCPTRGHDLSHCEICDIILVLLNQCPSSMINLGNCCCVVVSLLAAVDKQIPLNSACSPEPTVNGEYQWLVVKCIQRCLAQGGWMEIYSPW